MHVCSTIYPGLTQELEDQAQEAGCRLLSCPVFGRPDAVKAGNALFVCAGDPAAKEQACSSIRNLPANGSDESPHDPLSLTVSGPDADSVPVVPQHASASPASSHMWSRHMLDFQAG